MRERERSHPRPPGLVSAPEDVRRQLEGRVEVLERARKPHAALEAVLSSRAWKRRLRARPGLVPEVVADAAVVDEALERVRRRAAVEGWPDDAPAWKLARELEARRERLAELAWRRLESLTVVADTPSLAEALGRLDARVREQVRQGLGPGEVLVFDADSRQGGLRRRPGALGAWFRPGAAVSATVVLLGLALSPVLLGEGSRESLQLASVLLLARLLSPVLWPLLRSGGVRLTSERLLWLPAFGEPVAVRLDSIPDGGLRLDPKRRDVHVEGDSRLHARSVADAAELVVLLELHRQPPLRGAARAGVRLRDVVVYPATLGETRGHAVLRPQGVSFVPEGRGPEALRAVIGKARVPPSPVEVAWVLDALRWLPDGEFDACVARVVEATGGVRWSAWETRHVAGAPVWREIRLDHGTEVLRGRVDWPQQGAAEQLLGSWPRGTSSTGSGA